MRVRDVHRKKAALIECYGKVCALCGNEVSDEADITVDHIIPVAAGGSRHSMENLQIAHAGCNTAKGCTYTNNVHGRPGKWAEPHVKKILSNG